MRRLYSLPAVFMLVLMAGEAQAFLKVCNKSNESVYIAYGHADGDNWIASGWWSIDPGRCTNLISGNLKQRYYYLRAEGRNGGVWGGDYMFCTTPERFTLVDSEDCVSSRVDREGFFIVDTGDNLDWTTNLTSR